jgi:hypothetical protein
MNILHEFEEAGLLSERVVTGGGSQPASKDLPKVNPNVDQSINKVADVPDSEPGKAGDQNKDDDPTQNADEKYEDRMMEVAVKSMEAAEAAMAHTCEMCQKDKDNRYDEGKKSKLNEIYEACKGLRANLYQMATMEDY